MTWHIETYDGYEFGPYSNEIEAHGDAALRHIARHYGPYEIYSRIELNVTPDLNDLRTPLSFDIA